MRICGDTITSFMALLLNALGWLQAGTVGHYCIYVVVIEWAIAEWYGTIITSRYKKNTGLHSHVFTISYPRWDHVIPTIFHSKYAIGIVNQSHCISRLFIHVRPIIAQLIHVGLIDLRPIAADTDLRNALNSTFSTSKWMSIRPTSVCWKVCFYESVQRSMHSLVHPAR